MAQRLVLGLLALTLCAGSAAQADNDDCAEPMSTWQPREVVARMAVEHGWTVRRIKIDEGCYRLDARDAAGRRIEVRLNPATLLILEVEQEEEHDEHDQDDKPKTHDGD